MHSISLIVSELSVGYPRKPLLLSNLSFAASGGELIALLGRNGTGKSTLLKILAGDLNFSTGSIRLNGNAPSTLLILRRVFSLNLLPV